MVIRTIFNIFCFLAILIPTPVMAQTAIWKGGYSWSTTEDWEGLPLGVPYPNSEYDALVPTGNVYVVNGEQHSARNLTLSNPTSWSVVTVDDGALNVVGNIVVDIGDSERSNTVNVYWDGTLNVGGNVYLYGEQAQLAVYGTGSEENGTATVQGNIYGNGSVMVSSHTLTVGGEFGASQAVLASNGILHVDRLANGMDLHITDDNSTFNPYGKIVVENSSSINSLSVTLAPNKCGIFTEPGFTLIEGNVTYNSSTLTNKSNTFFELRGGQLLFDDAKYVDEGQVWNYDEEQYFNGDMHNVKLVGSANPEIILTLYENDYLLNRGAGYMAQLFMEKSQNSGVFATAYSDNQILVTGSFMDLGSAYMIFEMDEAGEFPWFRITGMELREIPTPEPATWAMLLCGGILLGIYKRRKRINA